MSNCSLVAEESVPVEVGLESERCTVALECISEEGNCDSIGRCGLGEFVLVSSPCLGGIETIPASNGPADVDVVEGGGVVFGLRELCIGVPGDLSSGSFSLSQHKVSPLVEGTIDPAVVLIGAGGTAEVGGWLRIIRRIVY